MKEKDIVNFDEMKKDPETGDPIDAEGNNVGCRICYTHDKAWDRLTERCFSKNGPFQSCIFEQMDYYHPLCPECGRPLVGGANHDYAPSGYVTVTEGNFSEPGGEVSLCQVWHCENEKCPSTNHQQLFAMMPIPIEWNANHDIHISGGKTYLLDEETQKFSKAIFETIKPSIDQYVRRKLNPVFDSDKSIDMSNLMLWCSRDVEKAIATWMYEHGLKK